MTAPRLYLTFCIAGTLLPLWQLLPFVAAHGLNAQEFARQLFANPVSSFFAMDVVVSSLVLWTLVLVDGARTGVRHRWLPIAASLIVGLSLGLPLFLYQRERALRLSGRASG